MKSPAASIIRFEIAYSFGIVCFGVLFVILCGAIIYGFVKAVITVLSGRLI